MTWSSMDFISSEIITRCFGWQAIVDRLKGFSARLNVQNGVPHRMLFSPKHL